MISLASARTVTGLTGAWVLVDLCAYGLVAQYCAVAFPKNIVTEAVPTGARQDERPPAVATAACCAFLEE